MVLIVLSNVPNGSLAYMQNVQAILYPEAVKPMVTEKNPKPVRRITKAKKRKVLRVAANRKHRRRNS